jgi:hypothetical protein
MEIYPAAQKEGQYRWLIFATLLTNVVHAVADIWDARF